MIEMFAGGKQLTLSADFKIRIEMNHPAFENDAIPASIAYNFDLPIKENKHILGYANEVETVNKYREYEWSMKYFGIVLFVGKMMVSDVTEVFSCSAIIRQLPANFSEKEIDRFPYKQLQRNNTEPIDNKWCVFPEVYAPGLYDGNSRTWGVNAPPIVNRTYPGGNETEAGNRESLIPMFTVLRLLDEIFKTEGYRVESSAVLPSFSDLTLFNNANLDESPSKFLIFQDLNDRNIDLNNVNEDEDGCIENGHYVVQEDGVYTFVLDFTLLIHVIKYGPYFPFSCFFSLRKLKLDDTYDYTRYPIYSSPHSLWKQDTELPLTFIRDITLKKGDQYSFLINFMRDDSIISGIDVKNGYFEVYLGGTSTDPEVDDPVKHKTTITVSNHLPAVPLRDLMVGFKQVCGLVYYIDNTMRRVQIAGCHQLLSSKALDLTLNVLDDDAEITVNPPKMYRMAYSNEEVKLNGQTPAVYKTFAEAPKPRRRGEIIEVANTNSFYQTKLVENVVERVRYGDSFRSVDFGSGETEEIAIPARPMSMTEHDGSQILFFDGIGKSDVFTASESKTDGLVFFLLKNGREGTTTDLDTAGQPVGGIAFNLHGENGLLSNFMKDWYNFLMSCNEYTFHFDVTPEDMLNIIRLFSYQPVAVSEQVRKVRINNQEYIPRQFSFELSHTGIVCQGKLMKNDDSI